MCWLTNFYQPKLRIKYQNNFYKLQVSQKSVYYSPTTLPPQPIKTIILQFSSQFDTARLSPNYATSDLGSSARSSFSTASSWMAYRDRSVDFDETGKELISPFDCDTACSVSPSFSLSPSSFHHFS